MSDRDELRRLTEPSYWEHIWRAAELPRLFDPSDGSLRNRGNMAFHRFFSEVLRDAPGADRSLVEIGCAQSKWLPYFRKEHGLSITGIDYSPFGCDRARLLLRQAGCEGDIVEADMFNPPNDLKSHFDVVLSMGLVEHFSDTAAAVAAGAALAKPGGIVVTTIPNLSGILGTVQHHLDRGVYEKHVPLTREDLREAHEKCGLSVLRSEYLGTTNFAIVNHPGLKQPIVSRLVRGALVGATGAVWVFDRFVAAIPGSRLLSSYVVCVARKA